MRRFRPSPRSWILGLFLVAAGCPYSGSDGTTIPQLPAGQVVTWSGEIRRIVTDHCLRCHALALQGAARGGAPTSVNFDTCELTRSVAGISENQITRGWMPPSQGLPGLDRALFARWVSQGASCADRSPVDETDGETGDTEIGDAP